MANRRLYKVVFLNHGKVYEVYAKSVASSELWGFTTISGLVFASSAVLVDPAEEKLKEEFGKTQALHLPMHAIVRIEEVEERGTAAIRDGTSGEKITPFPMPMRPAPDRS
jgi:hypothetical protein